MIENYKVGYSAESLDDLRKIYTYIANELLVPEIATNQVNRIRKESRMGTMEFYENTSITSR